MRVLAWLVLALVVRLLYLQAVADEAPFEHPYAGMDAERYDELARRVAAGDLALGDRVFDHSALYAYLLGAQYRLFGAGPWPARVSNILLGLGTVFLVHRLAREMAPEGATADVAAIGAALYGPYVVFDTSALKTTTGLFLVALGLHLVLRARRESTSWRWLGAGVALGAAYNLHAAVALFAVGVGGMLVRRRAWRDATLLALGGLLAVAPFALRNGLVAGEWQLARTGAGLHFCAANQEGAWGGYKKIPGVRPNPRGHVVDGRRIAEGALGRSLTAREIDAYYRARGLAFVKDHPARFAGLVGRRFLLALNAYEVPNNEHYGYLVSRSGLLRVLPGAAALIPLALLGLGLLVARGRLGFLPGLFLATQVLALLLGLVTWRYRLPLTLVAWPLAAAGLLALVEAAVARRYRTLALRVCCLAAATALTRLPFPSEKQRTGQFRQAAVKWRASETERALRRAPPGTRRQLALSELRERMQDLEGAIAVLETGPRTAETDAALARLREKLR